jgi:catechol 2,3-dioxygenase-like lactoylglutathione lyase family enzyme
MLTKLTHAPMWVTDQDEALAFYTDKLGLEVRQDVSLPELGGFRWLTVGVPGQEDVAITLLAIPGPPVFDEATKKLVEEVLAKGASPGLIFGTDDARGTYEELKGKGVEFTEEPTEQPYGVDAGIRDPFGNQMRIVQQDAQY